MGDRGQVFVKDEEIYLYTHWNATELVETVQKALARRERWDDPEYLARIVFQEMIGDDKGATGYGISSNKHGDIWRLITIDCANRKVVVNRYEEVQFDGSFEDFLKAEIVGEE